jgi:preprotein translocase subunit SecG
MRFLLIFQVILALLLTTSILMQNRGSGLGAVFGGDFGGYHTKRGFEKFLFRASIVLAILFSLASLANVYFGAHGVGA